MLLTNLFQENITLSIILLAYCRKDACQINETLTQKNHLTSSSGNYILYMEENGALYIVCKGQQIWSSKNSFIGAEGFYLESDGHALIYNSEGTIIWTFLVASSKPKAEALVLQNDGNLVLRAIDKTVLWASGSTGKCSAGMLHSRLFYRIKIPKEVWQEKWADFV